MIVLPWDMAVSDNGTNALHPCLKPKTPLLPGFRRAVLAPAAPDLRVRSAQVRDPARLRLVLRLRRLGGGGAECTGAGRAAPEDHVAQAGQARQGVPARQPHRALRHRHLPLRVLQHRQLRHVR
jgi:hypothetical protein